MRLLIFLPSTSLGGCEAYAATIAAAAVARGWEVAAVLPHTPATAPLHDLLRCGGVATADWFSYLAPRSGGDEEQEEAIRRAARELCPTASLIVLPCQDGSAGVMAGLADAGGASTVVFQNCAEHLALPPASVAAARRSLERGQRWICVSRHNRRIATSNFGVPASRIDLVPNGVDAPRAGKAAGAERGWLRAELELPADAAVLLGVGRLVPQKNPLLFVEGVAAVQARHPRAFGVWCGDGELREAAERRAAELGIAGRVRFCGQRADVDAVMAAADLLVFTSQWEGASFALLEALAAGLPVVASDAGSNAELVRHRTGGLLFTNGSPDSLESTLDWALEHPAEMRAMARAGRRSAARFSRRQMVDRTLRIVAR